MTLRLDRLQAGLYALFLGLATTVSWQYTQDPRDAASLLVLGLESGPTPHLASHATGSALLPLASVELTITAATLNGRTGARINGFTYAVNIGALDTITTVRDALLADILAGEPGAVTPTAVSTDGILLTAATLGGLRTPLALVGEIEFADDPTYAADAVLVRTDTLTALVSLEAFSHSREPRNGADSIMAAAITRLRSVAAVAALERYGVSRWQINDPINLSAIAGGSWETRARLTFTVCFLSVAIEPCDTIDNLDFDGIVAA